MSRNTELIMDEQGRERARHRLPYGVLLVADGEDVAAGKVLIEWDPYTMPIISELNGVLIAFICWKAYRCGSH